MQLDTKDGLRWLISATTIYQAKASQGDYILWLKEMAAPLNMKTIWGLQRREAQMMAMARWN